MSRGKLSGDGHAHSSFVAKGNLGGGGTGGGDGGGVGGENTRPTSMLGEHDPLKNEELVEFVSETEPSAFGGPPTNS